MTAGLTPDGPGETDTGTAGGEGAAGGERSREPIARPLFTFDTTHMALWAEEVARDRGIPAETVPAPPETRARCGLALETLDRFVPRLGEALDGAGVQFYPPGERP